MSTVTSLNFKELISLGIPEVLPEPKVIPADANRAPKRKEILDTNEKKLALRNALRYFKKIGILSLLKNSLKN